MMWAVCRNCEDEVVMRVNLWNKDLKKNDEQIMRMPKLHKITRALEQLEVSNQQFAKCPLCTGGLTDLRCHICLEPAWQSGTSGKLEACVTMSHVLCTSRKTDETDVSFASGCIARKIPKMREASPLQSSQLLHKLANVWCTQSWALRLMCAQPSQHWKAIRLQSVLPNRSRSWD